MSLGFFKSKLMETLSNTLLTLEPTDELILINKQYNKLDKIYDLASELSDLIESLEDINTECSDNLVKSFAKGQKHIDKPKMLKSLAELMKSSSFDLSMCINKSRELFFFQKMSRAIFAYKALKS